MVIDIFTKVNQMFKVGDKIISTAGYIYEVVAKKEKRYTLKDTHAVVVDFPTKIVETEFKNIHDDNEIEEIRVMPIKVTLKDKQDNILFLYANDDGDQQYVHMCGKFNIETLDGARKIKREIDKILKSFENNTKKNLKA